MDGSDWVALGGVVSGAVVAVAGMVIGPLIAKRHEDQRWRREHRAGLYVEMVAEAYAEWSYFERELAIMDHDDIDEQFERHHPGEDAGREDRRRETRALLAAGFTDTRLPAAERALLGACGTAFGSRKVNIAFNGMQGAMMRATLLGRRDPMLRMREKLEAGRHHDELQKLVCEEFETDPHWPLGSEDPQPHGHPTRTPRAGTGAPGRLALRQHQMFRGP